MPTFSNLKDLEKYVNNQNNSSKLNILTSGQLMKVLEREGERLKGYLEEEVQNYYNSYSPTVYTRTYNFLNSVRITPVFQEGNNLTVKIYFDEGMATHDSIFGGEDGYVPTLLEYGWQVKSDKVPNYYHLKYYEGFHFVDKAIEKYNRGNPNGFKIVKHAEHNGKVIEHRQW